MYFFFLQLVGICERYLNYYNCTETEEQKMLSIGKQNITLNNKIIIIIINITMQNEINNISINLM